MPIVDRREFGGRFTVTENAQRLANYRYLEVQLMEMIAGWSHSTPQLAFKAAFGYHVYDHAQAADMLGERLEQLRSGRDREEPATDDFARLCEHVWHFDATIERLVAVYRVLEPHLVSTYAYHADATDQLADAPTVRLLRHLAALDQSHVAWGQAVLDSLAQSSEDRRRALAVQADLEARLVACGGVTGQGIESHWLTFHSAKAEEKGRPRTKRGRSGYRYVKRCSPLDHPVVEAPFWFSENPEDFRAAYNAADEWSLEGFRHKFHQLLYGEVETTDRMGKMLAEFPQLPWEMRMELAHQMCRLPASRRADPRQAGDQVDQAADRARSRLPGGAGAVGAQSRRAHRGLLWPAGGVRAALHVPQAGPRRACRQRERHYRRVGIGLLPTARVWL
jgi:hypothetical protein